MTELADKLRSDDLLSTRMTAADFIENVGEKIIRLQRAVSFLDKVRKAAAEERISVGSDAWDWLESAAREITTINIPE